MHAPNMCIVVSSTFFIYEPVTPLIRDLFT